MIKGKIFPFLIILSLCFLIPGTSAQESPKIRVLLSKDPASCQISSENPFQVTFPASGSSLQFSPEELIAVSPFSPAHLVFLKQTSLNEASSIVANYSAMLQAWGKPLLGEVSGRSGLFLGPFNSQDEAQNALNSCLENFPQAALAYASFALKGKTPYPYDLLWGGDSPGKTFEFSSPGTVKFNERRYRGSVSLFANSREGKWELYVLNTLDLESYLCGVVPAEMPYEWPLEALKAQAVASRTFALKRIRESAAGGLPFDVNATVSDQVYRGFEAERETTNQAILETFGEVIKFEGNLITAAFHSCSGGYTENNENVWKGPAVPYLRGIPSPGEEGSKYFTWTRTVTLNSMSSKIEELKKVAIGEIQNFEILEKGISGRIKTLKVSGTTGTCTLSGEELRKVADLPSALVNWETQGERTFFLLSAKGAKETSLTQSFALSDSGTYPLPQKIWILSSAGLVEEEILPKLSGFIIFEGKGWGHGVGMPQWGAKARAEEGMGYREILNFYYQGITIEKEY